MLLTEAPDYLLKKGIKTNRTKMWRLVKEGTLPVYTNPLDKRKKLVKKADLDKFLHPTRNRKQTHKPQ